MPSGIIVTDLIKSSMRLNGLLSSGETPKANEANDMLNCLNDLLENWSNETLSVWGSSNQTFSLVPGQATYTIGIGANFNTQRPIDIDDAYCRFGGVDFRIDIMGQEKYNGIGLKAMAQPIVEQLLYVNEYPFGVITVWPVPTQAIPITLTMRRLLAFPVALSDALTGPPGFVKAVKYCLAVESAPEFGVSAAADVVVIAADAKGDFKRANQTIVESTYDPALTTPQVALYQRGY